MGAMLEMKASWEAGRRVCLARQGDHKGRPYRMTVLHAAGHDGGSCDQGRQRGSWRDRCGFGRCAVVVEQRPRGFSRPQV